MEILMKKILFALSALVVLLSFVNGHSSWAQSEPGYYSASDLPDDNMLTPEEMDDLVAPIALYPDPLIAQILPAATFVDQIDEAARYVRQYGRLARIEDQPWDVSVKAVAHYPDVLFMMDQKYDWTVSLGQAFIDQQQDLMESIQALRADALDQGNLVSTPQQQVIVEAGDIRIVPAVPEYIYVPVYDPQVVYVERAPSYGFITFGAGLAIGAWLSRDLDWREHRVYYHGWRGTGWVSRSRPHIHDRRGVYINNRGSAIATNRRVLQHDTNRFRQELRHDVQQRRELPGRPAHAPRFNQPRPGATGAPAANRPGAEQPRPGRPDANRSPGTDPNRPGRPDQSRRPGEQRTPGAAGPQGTPSGAQRPPAAAPQPAQATEPRNRPGSGPRPPAAAAPPAAAPPAATRPAPAPPAAVVGPAGGRPENRSNPGDVFRGRDVQKDQPASRSGYGGYGSSKDASSYRERGQSSRENMRQAPRAAQPAPAAAPTPKPAPAPAPAARPSAPPAPRAAAPAAAPAPRPHIPRPVAPPASPAAAPARPEGKREQSR
jgi:hypothetical protein